MRKKLGNFMNNLTIQTKLTLLYLVCVIVPLVITDGIVLALLIRAERTEAQHDMQNIAKAVSYELSSAFESSDSITRSIYMNYGIEEFLSTQYNSNLDFYKASRTILDSVFYDMTIGYSSAQLFLYADNDTIVNGGHFHQLASVADLAWYQEFQESGKNDDLVAYFDDSMRMTVNSQRRVAFVRRLNYFQNDGMEKIVKLDLDYNSINRKLKNMNFDTRVDVCAGDEILFSNSDAIKYTEPFEQFSGNGRVGYELSLSIYGDELRILVEQPENMVLNWLGNNLLWLVLLVGINVVLPLLLMRLINRSFVERLQVLNHAFDQVEVDNLDPVSDIQGTDEIASLMQNYNRMLARLQGLIQTVYKERLARQEIDLARQNAELQALHSQINPHFLFNVLESIRMHSLLKGEEETSEMIAHLALLERQSVRWTSDYVPIEEEIRFVEAYLELQKYRFGKRLSYEIQVASDCEKYYLPRLTLSTFVENACVHGMEGKAANCWVYIRIYEKSGWLHLEIEDTGSGMTEEMQKELLRQVEACDIHTVRESEHVGILNAYLRLKMVSQGAVKFEIESEEGAGCWFMIRVPVERLKRSGALQEKIQTQERSGFIADSTDTAGNRDDRAALMPPAAMQVRDRMTDCADNAREGCVREAPQETAVQKNGNREAPQETAAQKSGNREANREGAVAMNGGQGTDGSLSDGEKSENGGFYAEGNAGR